MKEIPYDVFGFTSSNVDDLVGVNALTCYGKAFLQAALLESEGLDWRFEYSKCPSDSIEETIKSMSDTNPLLNKIYDVFPNLFKNKTLMHTTVQVKVDDDWQRMDSTIPSNVCDKIKNDEKRERCQSLDNVTSVHECNVIGHGKNMPRKAISTWNAVSRLGSWVNDKFTRYKDRV